MCCPKPSSLAATVLVSHSAKGIRTMKSMVQVSPQPAGAGTQLRRSSQVLVMQHTQCWGRRCPFIMGGERGTEPRAITSGQLPVCVTPGHCEAVQCSPGDKAPLPVTPLLQVTLIINNLFKLNTSF